MRMAAPIPTMATTSDAIVWTGRKPASIPGRNASSAIMCVAHAVQPAATTLTTPHR